MKKEPRAAVLRIHSCTPPRVGVAVGETTGFFVEATPLARPNLQQLETILVELDVPEHDGSVHFLEVLLALLHWLYSPGAAPELLLSC